MKLRVVNYVVLVFLIFKVLPKACNFFKKETLTQVFSCEFCEISKNTFFTEHLWTTASGIMITIYDSFHNIIYLMLEVFFVEQKVFYFLARKSGILFLIVRVPNKFRKKTLDALKKLRDEGALQRSS